MTWQDYKKNFENNTKISENHYILGIDLGTTNSVISFWNDSSKKVEPIDISNGFGKISMPSVVQYRQDEDEWIVGSEAERSIKIYPESTIRSIKRKMGSDSKIQLGKDYTPEEISAKILTELIQSVYNINPNAEIAGLVVSVPYDFDDAAKKATISAIEIAGLSDKLIQLIEEPKAAALTYNFRSDLKKDENILIFDFGGGTLDITIFNIAEKTDKIIKLQVLSMGGKDAHGGDVIDDILTNYSLKVIEEKTGLTASELPPENLAEVYLRAREAKERLSGLKSFRLPFTFCNPPFVENITRESFEALIDDFIKKTHTLVQNSLNEAYFEPLAPESISRVLLEGGSSAMPWVKNMLVEIFGESKVFASERPALDISLGAAYYAAIKMGRLNTIDVGNDVTNSVEFEVVLPHDIGIEVQNSGKKIFFPIIRRGTPYPLAKKSHIFTLLGENYNTVKSFELKILERMSKNDPLEDCRTIGEIEIKGLPIRPTGKMRIEITLMAEEDGGIIEGIVKDLGFFKEYPPSGYEKSFVPSRFDKKIL